MNFNTGNYEMKPLDPKLKGQLKSIVTGIAVIVFLIVLATTAIFTVTEQDQAVVTRFGRHVRTMEAGLHFKLPFGIEAARRVPTNVIQSMEIGYRTNNDGSTVLILDESKMITGDLNIVNVDFFLEYRISDPVLFLFASQNPRVILGNIAQSRIRDIISSYNVDEVLTIRKLEIQVAIRDLLVRDLEEFDIGLSVVDLRIQDSDPADPAVIAAFRAVETARQNADTYRNEALAFRNREIPQAEAERDYLLTNAAFRRQDRINDAVRQVAMFEAMFSEYERSPNIHRQRIYYEIMEQVFPGVNLYVNTGSGDGDINMILPLADFVSGGSD